MNIQSGVNPKQPTRRRRKEARPAELIDAAVTLFIKNGYASTRLQDVAALAGVSKATLYLYFENKEALFKAVISQGVVPMLEEGAQLSADPHEDSATLIRQILKRWLTKFNASPLGGIPKLMISEARNFPDLALYHEQTAYKRAREVLGQLVDRGIARGEFRPVDKSAVVELLIAPLMMHLIWQHSMAACGCATIDPVSYMDTHLDLILAGLAR